MPPPAIVCSEALRRTYENIDIDYHQFPVPDLSLNLHRVHLSAAQHRAMKHTHREAEEQARRAKLWPLINHAVQEAARTAFRLRS